MAVALTVLLPAAVVTVVSSVAGRISVSVPLVLVGEGWRWCFVNELLG